MITANKIHHIGIAVKDLDDSIKVYRDLLGLELKEVEEVKEQKVKAASLKIGEVNIELLEATSADSAVAKHIDKRGEGLHHICIDVDDIKGALKNLAEAGVRLVDETPRTGAGGRLVAFLHPRSTSGVLVELSAVG